MNLSVNRKELNNVKIEIDNIYYKDCNTRFYNTTTSNEINIFTFTKSENKKYINIDLSDLDYLNTINLLIINNSSQETVTIDIQDSIPNSETVVSSDESIYDIKDTANLTLSNNTLEFVNIKILNVIEKVLFDNNSGSISIDLSQFSNLYGNIKINIFVEEGDIWKNSNLSFSVVNDNYYLDRSFVVKRAAGGNVDMFDNYIYQTYPNVNISSNDKTFYNLEPDENLITNNETPSYVENKIRFVENHNTTMSNIRALNSTNFSNGKILNSFVDKDINKNERVFMFFDNPSHLDSSVKIYFESIEKSKNKNRIHLKEKYYNLISVNDYIVINNKKNKVIEKNISSGENDVYSITIDDDINYCNATLVGFLIKNESYFYKMRYDYELTLDISDLKAISLPAIENVKTINTIGLSSFKENNLVHLIVVCCGSLNGKDQIFVYYMNFSTDEYDDSLEYMNNWKQLTYIGENRHPNICCTEDGTFHITWDGNPDGEYKSYYSSFGSGSPLYSRALMSAVLENNDIELLSNIDSDLYIYNSVDYSENNGNYSFSINPKENTFLLFSKLNKDVLYEEDLNNSKFYSYAFQFSLRENNILEKEDYDIDEEFENWLLDFNLNSEGYYERDGENFNILKNKSIYNKIIPLFGSYDNKTYDFAKTKREDNVFYNDFRISFGENICTTLNNYFVALVPEKYVFLAKNTSDTFTIEEYKEKVRTGKYKILLLTNDYENEKNIKISKKTYSLSDYVSFNISFNTQKLFRDFSIKEFNESNLDVTSVEVYVDGELSVENTYISKYEEYLFYTGIGIASDEKYYTEFLLDDEYFKYDDYEYNFNINDVKIGVNNLSENIYYNIPDRIKSYNDSSGNYSIKYYDSYIDEDYVNYDMSYLTEIENGNSVKIPLINSKSENCYITNDNKDLIFAYQLLKDGFWNIDLESLSFPNLNRDRISITKKQKENVLPVISNNNVYWIENNNKINKAKINKSKKTIQYFKNSNSLSFSIENLNCENFDKESCDFDDSLFDNCNFDENNKYVVYDQIFDDGESSSITSSVLELIQSVNGFSEDIYVDNEYAYVATGNNFCIYDIDNFNVISCYNSGNYILDITIKNNLAIISKGTSGFEILNISNKNNIIKIFSVNNSSMETWSSYLDNNLLYLANGSRGIDIYDISDLQNVTLVNNYNNLYAYSINIDDNYLYLSAWSDGFGIYKISGNSLTFKDSIILGKGRSSLIKNNYAFLANGNDGLRVLDISDKNNIQPVNHMSNLDHYYDLEIEDNILFVSTLNDGIITYDISDPLNIQIEDSEDNDILSRKISKFKNKLYVSCGNYLVKIFNF